MFIMLSACKATNHNVINLRNTLEVVNTLDLLGADYDVCDGYWKGKREDSIRLHCTPDTLAQALAFASDVMDAYEQEAIMYVDDQSQGYLLLPDGSSKLIGVWHQVSALHALGREAYTIIDGKYYGCF